MNIWGAEPADPLARIMSGFNALAKNTVTAARTGLLGNYKVSVEIDRKGKRKTERLSYPQAICELEEEYRHLLENCPVKLYNRMCHETLRVIREVKENLPFWSKTAKNLIKELEKRAEERAAADDKRVAKRKQAISSKFQRYYPPVSRVDTIELDTGESVHGKANLFADDEIVKVVRYWKGGQKTDQMNRHLIQQQSVRGCTAAVCAMLIKDKGGKTDHIGLESVNLGTLDDMKYDIESSGLSPIITKKVNLNALRRLITLNGSAIVPIDDEQLGSHVLIIDAISDEQARIRDPYHGWDITVTREALEKRASKGRFEYALQIE